MIQHIYTIIPQRVSVLCLFLISSFFSCKAVQPTPTAEASVTVSQEANVSEGTSIRGVLSIPKSGQLFLWVTYGKQLILTDSTRIENGNFAFAKRKLATGIYMLGTNDQNACPIIINEKDSLCEIGFKTGKLETSAYAISSEENEDWFTYLNSEMALLRAQRDALTAARKNPEMKTHFEEQAEKKVQELLELQNRLIAKHPDSFFARILMWKQEPNKVDFEKYWDNIDFSDERIIRTKVITERIQNFMRLFSKGEESGFTRCADEVANRAKANDVVLEFSLTQMLTGFYESGLENICAYLIDNYINGDACGDADLSETIRNTAEGISSLAIGHTPPNIEMQGISLPVNLYETATANTYTLVMFWSSWCEHCKAEAPQVVSMYNKWKSKGFEILAVSIDSNERTWKDAVVERKFDFLNVCGMNQYRSAVAQDYRITRTPSYFLLNSKKEIVLKPKSIQEINKFLNQELK